MWRCAFWVGIYICGPTPFFARTEEHAVRTCYFHLLATDRELEYVVVGMDTVSEGAAAPDAQMAPCESPAPALFPEEATPTTKEDSKDYRDRDGHDASVADISEKDAVAGSLTADAVNGDGDGPFIHDPMPLTDDQQVDSGYTSGTNGTFDDIWSPATKLKRRLEDTQDLIVCPGVYDGFSARIALSVGFEAMYMV